MTISIVYLCNQYNNVTPRPLECIYSIGYTQHIAFLYPLCALKPKDHIYIYILILTLELSHISNTIVRFNISLKWCIMIYIILCGRMAILGVIHPLILTTIQPLNHTICISMHATLIDLHLQSVQTIICFYFTKYIGTGC